MNKKIRELEDQLIALLNSAADVPIEAKRLILKDVTDMVTKKADEVIMAEMREAQNE